MQHQFTCRLCGNTSSRELFTSWDRHGRHDINTKDHFNLRICNTCRAVFIPDLKMNDAYYSKYYTEGYYDPAAHSKNIMQRLVGLLESWSLHNKQTIITDRVDKEKINILDIGCGNGKFLNSLDADRFNKHGIEINPEGVALCRKKGITVYDKDVTEIDFKGKLFDVITLWHVLEHLEKPLDVFRKIHEILADDGLLVFATPDTGSLGFRLGKAKWFHLDSPRHVVLFNGKSMRYLCDESGFAVESVINEYYDYPLDLMWSVMDSKLKYVIYPLYPLIKMLDKQAMTVVCRKK